MITEDEAVELVEGRLLELDVTRIGEPWESPFGLHLMSELGITGKRREEHNGDQNGSTVSGTKMVIPINALQILEEIATHRYEAAEILRVVCADVLAGEDRLPREVRSLIARLISREVKIKRKTKIQDASSARYKFVHRDRAIIQALCDLERDFGFLPTRTLSSKQDHASGAKIVCSAMAQIWTTSKDIASPRLSERSINSLWSKRSKLETSFDEAKSDVQTLLNK